MTVNHLRKTCIRGQITESGTSLVAMWRRRVGVAKPTVRRQRFGQRCFRSKYHPDTFRYSCLENSHLYTTRAPYPQVPSAPKSVAPLPLPATILYSTIQPGITEVRNLLRYACSSLPWLMLPCWESIIIFTGYSSRKTEVLVKSILHSRAWCSPKPKYCVSIFNQDFYSGDRIPIQKNQYVLCVSPDGRSELTTRGHRRRYNSRNTAYLWGRRQTLRITACSKPRRVQRVF